MDKFIQLTKFVDLDTIKDLQNLVAPVRGFGIPDVGRDALRYILVSDINASSFLAQPTPSQSIPLVPSSYTLILPTQLKDFIWNQVI